MEKLKIVITALFLFWGVGCSDVKDAADIRKYGYSREPKASCINPVADTLPTDEGKSFRGSLSGLTICIDPGHCVTNEKRQEQISPKSKETKNVFGGGTSGKTQTEEQLNLRVGLMLKESLETEGAEVLMTREVSEIAIDNIERAQIGNQANCCIQIHADGVEDPSVHGISVHVPTGELLGNPEIITASKKLGEFMLKRIIEQTGAKNRGVVNRSDLVGFNWSEVPVVLVEMGFMTNPKEDAQLESTEYQQLIVYGMTAAIIDWFSMQN